MLSQEELSHRLQDFSSTGNAIDWAKYKRNSLIISESMFRSGLKKRAYYLKYCGTHLTFAETMSDRLKLIEADFCKDRLCPMCTWRRSLKLFGQTSKLMKYINSKEKVRYVFLTLTVKNCEGKDLSKMFNELVQGFSRLMRRKEVKDNIIGACRQIEVTFNSNPYSKSFQTFHPHLHIILAVRPSYFSRKIMISQKKWREMWADCMKIDYDPQIDIQAIKLGKNEIDETREQEKAVAELSKYPVKMDSLINIDEAFRDIQDYGIYNMAVGLVNKRLIEYYGIFRKYRRELKLEDIENGDLVCTDIQDNENDELTGVIRKYQWRIGFYIECEEHSPVEF